MQKTFKQLLEIRAKKLAFKSVNEMYMNVPVAKLVEISSSVAEEFARQDTTSAGYHIMKAALGTLSVIPKDMYQREDFGFNTVEFCKKTMVKVEEINLILKETENIKSKKSK